MKSFKALFLTALLLTGTLTGCASSSSQVASSTPPKANEPLTITMFGYWNDMRTQSPVPAFKAAMAEKFPEIDFQYESFPAGEDAYTDEVNRRVMHDDASDIILTMDTSLHGSGKLMDLTQEEFASRYSVATMKHLSENGTVYFLPALGSVQCYAYNATQFEEMKLDPPKTLGELETVMATLTTAGSHPFVVPYAQNKPLFIKILAAGYLATPEGQLWLADYNMGKATMEGNPNWEAVWQRAERMTSAGYLAAEDSLFADGRRITMLQSGLGSMTGISSSMYSILQEENAKKLKFSLFPLVGEKTENQTVFSAPTGYFAANNQLNQPENKAKKDAILKIFDFISTEEGQVAIRGTAPLSNSYLRSVALKFDDEAQSIADILNAGSFGPPPTFERGVDTIVGDVFGKILEGKMTGAEALAACDSQNASYKVMEAPPIPEVLGTATEKFPWVYRESRSLELAVTNFVVDCIKSALGTDIALELGTAVRGEFFKGDITTQDVNSVVRMDRKLYRTEVTGQQLWNLIEQGVKTPSSSWFIVVSGLKYSYQPPQGEIAGKLLELTMADGTPVDLNKSYKVAVSENQTSEIPNFYSFFGIPSEDSGITLRQAVISSIKAQKTISPVLEGRITVK